MERLELQPGKRFMGEEIVAVCHFPERSVVVRKDAQMSVPGDDRYALHLFTDHSARHGEAYQSQYGIAARHLRTWVERCLPDNVGGGPL